MVLIAIAVIAQTKTITMNANKPWKRSRSEIPMPLSQRYIQTEAFTLKDVTARSQGVSRSTVNATRMGSDVLIGALAKAARIAKTGTSQVPSRMSNNSRMMNY